MHFGSIQRYINRMASLLPLIQDILPMILPASITVTKAADILPPVTERSGDGQERSGVQVISRNAVVDKTDRMCASGEQCYLLAQTTDRLVKPASPVLIVKPKSCSSVRHHGEQGTLFVQSLPLSPTTTYIGRVEIPPSFEPQA
jgi:hypothetical protein